MKPSRTDRWRIIAMVLRDKAYLNSTEPADVAFAGRLGAEFAFGCVTGDIRCPVTSKGVAFTSEAKEEMQEALGDNSVEIQKIDSLKGDIHFSHRRRFDLRGSPTVSSSAAR